MLQESAIDFSEIEEALVLVKQKKQQSVPDPDFLQRVDREMSKGENMVSLYKYKDIYTCICTEASTCICVHTFCRLSYSRRKTCSALVSTCLHHEFNSVHLFSQMNTGNYWSYKRSMPSVSMSWRRLVTCSSYNTRSIRTTSKRLEKLFFKPWFMLMYFVHRYIFINHKIFHPVLNTCMRIGWNILWLTKSFDLYIGSMPSVCYLMIIFV